MFKKVLWFMVFPAMLAACGSDSREIVGQAVYMEPDESGNRFACATCHALTEPAADLMRRPGHPIGDALSRPSYKNGEVDSFLAAANSCRQEWMNAEEWTLDSQAFIALEGYLAEQAPGISAPALEFEIVEPPDAVDGGDAERGQSVFNQSCIVCHGENATGTERAPALVGELLDSGYIAERVRLSGRVDSAIYDGLTGGVMPFWSADRLSNEELIDVVAFVLANDPNRPGSGPGGTLRECDSTDPRIGHIAELDELFHDVGGTATIIDDCTIEVSGFTFDGTGIDVRFYGGLAGEYDDGFSMSTDLRRDTPYAGETVVAQLPEGKSLSDIDGISVWCVPAGVSFGDGMFSAP